MKRVIMIAGLMLFWTGIVSAEVKLPAIFSSGMVLQRETQVPVWGWADPGEKIAITASWGAQASAVADKSGKWNTVLGTPAAGGPFTISIKGANEIVLKNVLAGEVWLCSGQSNMAMAVNKVFNAQKEIAAAAYPNIRLFKVEQTASIKRLDDCTGRWKSCSPVTVRYFSAAGYFFGRKIYMELKDVPVGLIQAAWGGSCIEAWTPWNAQENDKCALKRRADLEKRVPGYDETAERKKFAAAMADWKNKTRLWKENGSIGRAPKRPAFSEHPHKFKNYPSNLYRGMIAPIEGYAVRGAIWYQGETNARSIDDAIHYRKQLETLIAAWRKIWNRGDFPFYFVQLPGYTAPWKKPAELKQKWPYIRESFLKASQDIPNADMAVTIDVGEAKDIHPKNKQAVGDRLARLVLHDVYKHKDIVRSGPVVSKAYKNGGKVTLIFNNGGGALAVNGDRLGGFGLQDMRGNVFKAKAAIIDSNKVEVASDKVKDPVMVYYGWANNPVGSNLQNKAGLPASPFRLKVKP
ncbi:MAG: sialate O-acetylesterase [Victivallales bacterium]|nr:sialate O-acetylesterase [Victivallales bacterium]